MLVNYFVPYPAHLCKSSFKFLVKNYFSKFDSGSMCIYTLLQRNKRGN